MRKRKSDKVWVTQSSNLLIKRRQRAVYLYRKTSEIYKNWRNKVQKEVKIARNKFYNQSVKKLKNTNIMVYIIPTVLVP
jgi:hypothetical protein